MYKSQENSYRSLKNANLTSSTRLNYSQNRAYIFTEKTAKRE